MTAYYDPELVDHSLIADFPEDAPIEPRARFVREVHPSLASAQEIGRAIASQAHLALTEKVMREYTSQNAHRNF